MGRRNRRPRGRDVNGILLFDKPIGLSSNEALQEVKKLFFAQKAGHTGSLDKLATGLLPICFGEATKISGFLLNADKRYEATLKLGEVSTTGDAEGEITPRGDVPALSSEELENVLAAFRGPISQIPPMHSAIKQKGQPLYKLAHQGIEVEREARNVEVHQLTVTGRREQELDIEVHCSKGTYIRTLAEDIGAAMGCGAYVIRLRRIGAGPYGQDALFTMEQLQAIRETGDGQLDKILLSVETALDDWPDVRLPKDMVFYMRQGQPVMVPHAPTNGWVRLYAGENRFFGVGEVLADGRIAPRRILKKVDIVGG